MAETQIAELPIGLGSIFLKTLVITQKKKKELQPEHAFKESKIPTSDWGWDLPISKSGCGASGLHVFVK